MATDFGKDTSCTTQLRTGRYVSGPQLVAEACWRRLNTPRGMLRGGEEEANYGFDLAQFVGRTNPKSVAAQLPGRIRSELKKDQRVDSVDVNVVPITDGPETSFTITVVVQTGEGPFTLAILASALTVELLGIT